MHSLTFSTLVALACAVGSVSAQSDIEFAAIKAHFNQSGLVPSLFTTFDPVALLSVSFSGVGSISPGQTLTQAQVQPQPTLTVTAKNSSVKFDGNFTVAMVDAGNVRHDQTTGQTRHWLVNSATIPSGSAVEYGSAAVITKYAGPAPPKGDGPHRYILAVFYQPSTFKRPPGFTNPGVSVGTYSLPNYAKGSGLGSLVAANYFDVETGNATVSLFSTSPVVSSTLAPGSADSSGASSATGSASNTASASTPSKTGGAQTTVALGGMTFVGLLLAILM